MVESMDTALTVVDASRRRKLIGFKELWQYRELLQVLTMRDIRVRYKQTLLGMAWAVLQPMFAMVVFTIALNRVAGVEGAGDVPYPVYSYAGLVIWLYFADALGRSSSSLVANNMLVTKVYFPKLIAPLAGVASPTLDFFIAFAILIVLMVVYGVAIPLTMLLVPLLFLMAALCAAAFGIWLSALNVEYRDVGYAVPLLVQLWLFLTPVLYSVDNVDGSLRAVYALNPMAGVVIAFRWCVLDEGDLDWGVMGPSFGLLAAVLVSGVVYFRRVERTFADSI